MCEWTGWMDGWMDTPQTVTTTRAPAVLKTATTIFAQNDDQDVHICTKKFCVLLLQKQKVL